MSHKPRRTLKTAFLHGTAFMVLLLMCSSSALAQKFAEQSGKKSNSKSYASANSQYNGNSYASRGSAAASSYASSGRASGGGTSYAQGFQARTSSYASSGGNGTSYASSAGYGNSYANHGSTYNSSKVVPYSQQIKFGNSSGGSLLGIMRGAPAARTQSDYSSRMHPKNPYLRRSPASGNRTEPTASSAQTAKAETRKADPKQSIFAKLH